MFLVAIALLLQGASSEIGGSLDDTRGAGVVCRQPLYAFPVARSGTSIEHTFQVVNESQFIALVQSVNTSCGCTAASVTPGTEIAPGNTIDVPVRVALDGAGKKEASVFLKVQGGSKSSMLELKIQGVVQEDCPKTLDIGVTTRDAGAAKTFLVQGFPGQPDIKILGISGGGDSVSARELPGSQNAANAATVEVTINSEAPYGQFQIPIEILTNDAEVPTKKINITGYVLLPIEASEKSIYFGALTPNAAYTKRTEIWSPYGKAVEIVNVENSREDVFTWSVADGDQPADKIPIEIATTGVVPDALAAGVLKGTLVFHARVGDEDQRVRVEVYGLIP